jgi:hypothetical protein
VRRASVNVIMAHDGFTLPPALFDESWSIVIDTTKEVGEREGRFTAGSALAVEGRSVIVLSPV